MRGTFGDIRYGLRMLAKHRSFSVVSILTLAIGLGAISTVFSVVYSLIWRPLPFPDAERLVFLTESSKRIERMSVSYPNFMDWKEASTVFEHIAAHKPASCTLTGFEQPERLQVFMVSANLLTLLDVEPALGRGFLEEEDRPAAENVVMLNHEFWERRFAADPSIVGKTIDLDGVPFMVIGVTPSGFLYPIPMHASGTDVYLPIGRFSEAWRQNRGSHPAITVTARRKPGVSLGQAQMEMAVIAERLENEYPATNTGQTVRVDPLQGFHVQDMRPSLLLLFAAVGLVLIIACSNAAHLLLARASTRSQEIAVRSALGASRKRIMRQLLVESLIQSLLGGCLGFLVAVWGVELISLLIPASAPPIYHQIDVDFMVLGFTFLVALTTGIVFGLLPALSVSRPNLTESLKEGGRSPSGELQGGTIRRTLIVAEMALAVVLLMEAGLMMKSFIAVMLESPGFNSHDTLTVAIGLPEAQYPESHEATAFYHSLEQNLKSLPGVRAVGLTDPLLWGSDYGFVIEGRPAPELNSIPVTDGLVVSPDYFGAMEIPLLRGRLFTESDREDTPRVAVINQRFAEAQWPDGDPIGKRIKLSGNPESDVPWLQVIGVVGHVKNKGVDKESRATTYRPYFQEPERYMTVVVRTETDAETLAAAIRAEVAKLDPQQPIYRVRTLEQYLANEMVPRRVSSVTMLAFATVALILAAVGLYGLMTYLVSQRTREIGLRMALGAKANDILRMVLGEVGRLTFLGVVIGSLAAFFITPFMTSLLFGVSPRDPWMFTGIVLLLGTVTLVSALLPARRAVRVEPLVALRYE